MYVLILKNAYGPLFRVDCKTHPYAKKLQHSREIPSVELTCFDRVASPGMRGAQESKGAN